MSSPDFGTTTIGLTYGEGPCAGSIMSSSMSSLIFSSNFDLMLNGVLRIGCATGFTSGSMWSCTALSLCLCQLSNAAENIWVFFCRTSPMVFGFALTVAMPIPIFSTPRLVAVSYPRNGSLSPLITQNVALAVLLPAETSQENVLITSSGMHRHRVSYSSVLIRTLLCFSSTTPMFACQ